MMLEQITPLALEYHSRALQLEVRPLVLPLVLLVE